MDEKKKDADGEIEAQSFHVRRKSDAELEDELRDARIRKAHLETEMIYSDTEDQVTWSRLTWLWHDLETKIASLTTELAIRRK